MEEIWVDIEGYKGLYQVSNQGRVKSLERMVKHYKGGDKLLQERFLKPNGNNYYQVNLFKNCIPKIFTIHQLVATHFLGHIPNGMNIVVYHINGVKTDNRLENLQLVTPRENSSTCYLKNRETFSSQYVGVSWYKKGKKWQSAIQINGKSKNLGLFDSEIEAHEAYQNKLNSL